MEARRHDPHTGQIELRPGVHFVPGPLRLVDESTGGRTYRDVERELREWALSLAERHPVAGRAGSLLLGFALGGWLA